MNNGFFLKLAVTNIRKNAKTYLPYIITCIFTIMMFYIMDAITDSKSLTSASLKSVLTFGTYVIGIFATIFLFYTNSFLIKRRKKEIGLYNILGLGKIHIAKVLFIENIIVSVVSLILGLLSGIVLYKLMLMALMKLLQFEIRFRFEISVLAIEVTVLLFTGIFIATLLYNLFNITVSNPIDLLKGGQVGEKEPKTKIIMTILGVAALGIAYYIAVTVKSPLGALNLFFLAVVLVIIGTFFLFTSGSIAALKLLRKNKSFYYKTNNFMAVSGMIYRMKQNASGLANICILSTFVLVMLTTTFSLYVGLEDALGNRYNREFSVTSGVDQLKNTGTIDKKIKDILLKNNIKEQKPLEYSSVLLLCKRTGDTFISSNKKYYGNDNEVLAALPLSDYNRLEGKNEKLLDDEILVFSALGDYGSKTLSLDGKKYYVKNELQNISISKKNGEITNTYIVVMNENIIQKNIIDLRNNKANDNKFLTKYDHYYTFDVNENAATKLKQFDVLKKEIKTISNDSSIDGREYMKSGFLEIYGCLFFLGLFLGSLFLMATVLIIYYKQISEGYDDKHRFEIMQKVGMGKHEIKSIIKRQILMVFFLPIIFAGIHIGFAFPIITKLMAVMSFVNTQLFLIVSVITFLVFFVAYGIVYTMTARVYYKIVE